VPSDSNAIPAKFPVGIAVFETNRTVMLPWVLQTLWREGRVQDHLLPELLHRAEGKLKSSDYPGSRVDGEHLLAMIIICAVLAVAHLAIGLYMRPLGTRAVRYLPATEWLQAKAEAGYPIWLDGDLVAGEVVPLEKPLTPPERMTGFGSGKLSSLGVVSAGRERRLVLFGEWNLKSPRGAVLRTEEVGLPQPVLADLRNRYPNLNTLTVFCIGWGWLGEMVAYDAEVASIPRWASAFWGTLSLWALAAWARFQRRQERLSQFFQQSS
jgi:hypothetical protein